MFSKAEVGRIASKNEGVREQSKGSEADHKDAIDICRGGVG